MPREALQSLTEPMFYVLLSLKQSPLCGIEIMESAKNLSHGRVLIGPGTLYTMLAKFEENKLIILLPDLANPKRKTYQITTLGEDSLYQEYKRLKTTVLDAEKIMEVTTK